MSKMATMPINGLNLQQSLVTRRPMSVNLGMGQQGIKIYKVYINDDFGLTLIFSMASSNFVKITYCAFARPKCQKRVNRTFSPLVLYFA